jgi:hypothetical protein
MPSFRLRFEAAYGAGVLTPAGGSSIVGLHMRRLLHHNQRSTRTGAGTRTMRSHRRFVRQVGPARLRPVWSWAIKVALTVAVAPVLFAFTGWAARVAAAAMVEHDWPEIQAQAAELQEQWRRERDAVTPQVWSYECVPGDGLPRSLCEP